MAVLTPCEVCQSRGTRGAAQRLAPKGASLMSPSQMWGVDVTDIVAILKGRHIGVENLW